MAETADGRHAARHRLMEILAQASRREIGDALAAFDQLPDFDDVRRPETGLVMLRGRIAGTGAPFNVGEATVTRAVVRLKTGEIGFSYVLGRDRDKARLSAFVDALWSTDAFRDDVEAKILTPLGARLADRDRTAAEQTAATRVDFFTLVRGEDPVR